MEITISDSIRQHDAEVSSLIALLPSDVLEKLQAGAFRSLCEHLQERSDVVSNMDLMTVSGFCRNCLAKWIVVEARKLSKSQSMTSAPSEQSLQPVKSNQDTTTLSILDELGYAEGAQIVYGMKYDDWKNRFQKEATPEQIDKYNASKHIHSQFDKDLLKPKQVRSKWPSTAIPIQTTNINTAVATESPLESQSIPIPLPLASNVCCEDFQPVASVALSSTSQEQPQAHIQAQTQQLDVGNNIEKEQRSCLVPSTVASSKLNNQPNQLEISIAVVTVSDRAFLGQYTSGDLSGPAVRRAIELCIANHKTTNNTNNTNLYNDCILRNITFLPAVVVPDELISIQKAIVHNSKHCDLVITTGGTGFGPRDVTPEATRTIQGFRECFGFMSYILLQQQHQHHVSTSSSSQLQYPLSTLSRGTAGIYNSPNNQSFIINLPGNPNAAYDIMPILLPLAIQAITDLRQTKY